MHFIAIKVLSRVVPCVRSTTTSMFTILLKGKMESLHIFRNVLTLFDLGRTTACKVKDTHL